jgi:hypothetical protein
MADNCDVAIAVSVTVTAASCICLGICTGVIAKFILIGWLFKR